jgi:TolB-like protein
MYTTRQLHLCGMSFFLALPIALLSHPEPLIAQNTPATSMSQATSGGYEATLKTVAARLVAQLELAHQKSGTVLDFTDLQGQGTELGRLLAQELSDQLVSEAKSFSLVDRASLQFLLKENKLSMEGLIDPDTSRKLGNMIGIDTVIMGTITPIGHSARLSVRAVAVETGKIVTSQSITVPLTDQLSELYTHGVAADRAPGEMPSGASDKRAAPDIRGTFRSDSLKVTGKFVQFTSWANNGMMCPNGDSCATASFVIENLSGLGVNGAIRRGSTSIGGCVGHERESAGLNVYGPITDVTFGTVYTSFQPAMRFIPPGAKIPVTVKIGNCGYAGARTVDVSAALTVSAKDQIIEIPVSVSNVPVQ